MKTKVTAVSIVEKTIPQELQILIEETAIKAYEYGITHKELVVELDIAREKHKRSKSICPIKDEKFSEFRLKTEKFFSNPDLLHGSAVQNAAVCPDDQDILLLISQIQMEYD